MTEAIRMVVTSTASSGYTVAAFCVMFVMWLVWSDRQ